MIVFGRRGFLAGVGCAAAAHALPSFLLGESSPSLAALAHDPLRPSYHLLPPHNWMNDPNGPIWWKGKYHLFYQLNPNAAVWGDMHWGHVISGDMVHWQHEPIALAPTPGGADSEGCFSGSAVVFNGVPTILYTGVQNATPGNATIRDGNDKLRETQLLATAESDDLLHWKKRAEPAIAAPPPGMQVTGFRDPCPWKEEDGWYLGVGSGQRGVGGCVLLYRSQDLRHWDYLHNLAEGKPNGRQAVNPVDSGEMWECPDFFPLGDRHVLLYSTGGHVLWTSGRYDTKTHRYTPDHTAPLDHGAYYAPKSFVAPDGRRILWGWIQETRPEAQYSAAGWAGAMSLPRVLTLNAAGRLNIAPAKEVETLRGAVERAQVRTGTPYRCKLEHLRCEVRIRAAQAHAALTVRLLGTGGEAWKLAYDGATGATTCGDIHFTTEGAEDRAPELRIFLDGSVIETFLNSTDALSSRVYSVQPGATELVVECSGAGGATVERWAMRAISPDRMTT